MLVNAATGSPKNIAPVRLMATSNTSASKGWIWAWSCSNRTLVRPSRLARIVAHSIIADDRSTPSADPAVAARATSRVV